MLNKNAIKAKVNVLDSSNIVYEYDTYFLAIMSLRTIENPPTTTSKGKKFL